VLLEPDAVLNTEDVPTGDKLGMGGMLVNTELDAEKLGLKLEDGTPETSLDVDEAGSPGSISKNSGCIHGRQTKI
jgi:hypothetical protein